MRSGGGAAAWEFVVKVAVLGQDKVGKTALVSQLKEGSFCADYTPTIVMEFQIKRFSLDSNQVRFQIWDTAGQERFETMIPTSIRSSHMPIVMYNNDAGSLKKAQKWIGKVKEDGPTKKILLVHNPFSHGEALETETQRSAGADIAEKDDNITFRQINVKTMRSDDITALLTEMWRLAEPSLQASASSVVREADMWGSQGNEEEEELELEEGNCRGPCSVM